MRQITDALALLVTTIGTAALYLFIATQELPPFWSFVTAVLFFLIALEILFGEI